DPTDAGAYNTLDCQAACRSLKDACMKKFRLLTPGPTPVPEETLLELARPVGYHRTPEFRQLLAEVLEDLKYVFQTKNPVLALTSSGTGGLEAAVANCLPAAS